MTETTNARCQAAPGVEVRVHQRLLAARPKTFMPVRAACSASPRNDDPVTGSAAQ